MSKKYTQNLPASQEIFDEICISGANDKGIATDIVIPSRQQLSFHQCARVTAALAADTPVILPTETVYGLAANAVSDTAVSAIYTMKGRPSFNPLICHVSCPDMAKTYGKLTKVADRLIRAFWPGPLTLVVEKRNSSAISALVTAGLETIAIRCPDTMLMRQIIAAFGKPLAAPSANLSGLTSPTTVQDAILALKGRATLAVDGGQTKGGIESTIVRVEENTLTLLRPGLVTPQDILDRTGLAVTALSDSAKDASKKAPLAPGMLERHYAPGKPLYMNVTEKKRDHFLIGFGAIAGDQSLSQSGDLKEAAHSLYRLIRIADQTTAVGIDVAPVPMTGIGIALNDRLKRASVPERHPRQSTEGAGNS